MRWTFAALAAIACLAWSTAQAQNSTYPSRTVTIVVPQAPGGTNDVVGRFMADRLSQVMDQRFVVENRVGAGGNVGTASVARSQPDGYTLLVSVDNPLAINPNLYKSVGFDPVADFEPITLIATVPYVLVVNPRYAASTMPELIKLAKEKPGQVQYASSGIGTVNHLLVEMLGFETDTKFVHVPYRGVSALMSDLIAGHVDIGFATMPAAQSHIASGTLKALGVSSPKRLDIARDIPAVSETVPGYGTELWVGFFAVKGTPPEIVARLKQEAGKILNNPPAREALVKMGAQPNPSTGEELTVRLKADLEKWKGVIARVGAKVE